MKVSCLVCNKEFSVFPSRVESNKTGYFCCSIECLAIRNTAAPNVKCDYCGKMFHKKAGRLTKTNCCSIKCRGNLIKSLYKGDSNPNWGNKGTLNPICISDVVVSNYGYILIRKQNHPFRNCDDFVFAHRLIMEEWLRLTEPDSEYLVEVENFTESFLSPDVCVHHKDENKLNNTLSNLEILTHGDHLALHGHMRIKEYIRDEQGRFVKTRGKKQGNLKRKYILDAGLDVYSSIDYVLEKRSRGIIHTGLKVEIPKNHVGLLWSRSGLSAKYGIEVGAGCIDSTYRGDIDVILYNHSDINYEIKKGDRVAQLLTIPINIYEYEDSILSSTERGKNGFGSTGV